MESEYLRYLWQGVDAWNAWRKKNQIDLDLNNAPFDYAPFKNIDFSKTDLVNASLREASLQNANFRRANLSGATLSSADLSGADLSDAALIETNLSGAALTSANLTGADLTYANLDKAYLGGTIFNRVDLSTVQNLETIIHEFPSTIGIDTLYRSKGHIPEMFLRKTGVPESFITHMSALVSSMSPIEFYSCFISYSSRDQNFAGRLYADLQAQGVRCWFAPEDFKIGDHYHQRIDESIRLYDKLILILSEHAIQSTWVEREMLAAREKEDREQRLVLFPVRLDERVLQTTKAWAADVRRRWHIGDFTSWKEHDEYQKAFHRLLWDLKAETN